MDMVIVAFSRSDDPGQIRVICQFLLQAMPSLDPLTPGC